MRSYQVFASMSPEQTTRMLKALKQNAPGVFAQALAATATAFKARPVYLARQPVEKQAVSVRRALARVGANAVAEELLAIYFLECKRDLLVEWLDSLGIAHEDGALEEEAPEAPPAEELTRAAQAFRSAGDDDDRELMLAAFAAQSSIEWPVLDELIGQGG